uniref:CD209 antigen-like protein E n=1 Tax=Paramormyrops kingsleyae TaxID=1676925 RepID=A0A3B3RCX8_9TELE
MLCFLLLTALIVLGQPSSTPYHVSGPAVRICPQNWMSFNLSCYYISNETQTWNDSRKKCTEKGADLVIISSRVEQVFIDDFNGRFWIGLTDLHEEGTWKWVDGEVIPKEKGLWRKGQSDDFQEEDCVESRNTGTEDMKRWNDKNCNVRLQYICEKGSKFLKPKQYQWLHDAL